LGTNAKLIVSGPGFAFAALIAWRSVNGFGTSGVGGSGTAESDVEVTT
jgi:hypothetical protein